MSVGWKFRCAFAGYILPRVSYEAVAKMSAGATVTQWLDWAGRSTSKMLTFMALGWRPQFLTVVLKHMWVSL